MDATASAATPTSPGAADADVMIRLEGVGKTYPDGTVAVHELDLDVNDPEFALAMANRLHALVGERS